LRDRDITGQPAGEKVSLRDELAALISRRQFLKQAGAGGALLLIPGLAWAHGPSPAPGRGAESETGDSVVVRWNAAALQGVRDSKLGPPMVARSLAIVHTCVYDAWAAYNGQAIGTRLGAALRRPSREHTRTNQETAISFAAYRAAVDLFPGDKVSVFDPMMISLGLNPNNMTTDATTPVGIGNFAARAVLEFRHRDGANQVGDEPGGMSGSPYSDYTGYKSSNAPMDTRLAFDRRRFTIRASGSPFAISTRPEPLLPSRLAVRSGSG
jgi:TAT (twin-arginine translocation) pathway signal sequence